jgi:hypothetical protein
MIDKNPQALALAFKKCRGKLLKINELSITPDMKAEAVDKLIETLAEAKAKAGDSTSSMTEFVAGQRWYVESLVKFSGLETEAQLQAEYEDSFAESASEAEMLTALKSIAA